MKSYTVGRLYINIAGEWQFRAILDNEQNLPDNLCGKVQLPGTTDTNHKGYPLDNKNETSHLSRHYSYVGKAEYSREVFVPKEWKGNSILLHLGRTKPTEVYVNGVLAGNSDDISTEQIYDISNFIKLGKKNKIAIIVDNSINAIPPQVLSSSHAYSEETQTNWNGIIGGMYLEAVKPLHISSFDIIPSEQEDEFQVSLQIEGEIKCRSVLRIILIPWGESYGYIVGEKDLYKQKGRFHRMRFICRKDSLLKWDEFHPNFYTIRVELMGYDKMDKIYGFRDFKKDGNQFVVNGKPIFLRGKQDACVFPYTGHVPMDMDSWRRYFQICKGYGMNYIRFHSWCPPEACFLAADIEGIYLQPELPFGGDFKGDDSNLMSFLYKEGANIIRKYGNHPSFVMLSLGNELSGSVSMMHKFVDYYRNIDSSKLYNFGSDYNISHETGQVSIYPDFNEINKYTGVLYPYNMENLRSRLEKAGMLNQAEAFHRVSGAWSTLLYKAAIEQDLRTKALAGFQLFDLQDYPGLGGKYIGVLDAFMEPKGLITPMEWRNFCSSIVPLFVADKFCYTNNELLKGKVLLSNYGSNEDMQKWFDGAIKWQLRTDNGIVVKEGEMGIPEDCIGLTDIDSISIDISDIKEASKLNLVLNAYLNKESPDFYTNSWPIWVYPSENNISELKEGIIVTDKMTDEIGGKLQNGAKVLFMPDTTQLHNLTVQGSLQTSCLIASQHPIFTSFPTDEHTNWQWISIIKASRPFILDNMPQEYLPIVQVVDNIERNHKLGLIFEMAVGKGKLLVCMSNLLSMQKYPEARQLYTSILQYMQSDKFAPKDKMTFEDLKLLLF